MTLPKAPIFFTIGQLEIGMTAVGHLKLRDVYHLTPIQLGSELSIFNCLIGLSHKGSPLWCKWVKLSGKFLLTICSLSQGLQSLLPTPTQKQKLDWNCGLLSFNFFGQKIHWKKLSFRFLTSHYSPPPPTTWNNKLDCSSQKMHTGRVLLLALRPTPSWFGMNCPCTRTASTRNKLSQICSVNVPVIHPKLF